MTRTTVLLFGLLLAPAGCSDSTGLILDRPDGGTDGGGDGLPCVPTGGETIVCEGGELGWSSGGTCRGSFGCDAGTTEITISCGPHLDCSLGCAAPGASPPLVSFEDLGIEPTGGPDAVDCCALFVDLSNLGIICPCAGDAECEDGDPCTADRCSDGRCESAPVVADADGDGHGAAACGGDDCNDGEAAAYPGAARQCGRGLDFDCDGIVDDAEGCGTCSSATDLVLREGASIATPAVGLFALGSTGPGGSQELFVGTSAGLEVYAVPEDGAPTLLGASDFPGVTPSPPAVVGGYLLVADVEGDGGVLLYSLADLRAGGAAPLTTVGQSLGVLSAFTADARTLYANVGSGSGALATASLASLPALAEPETVLASGEWGNCRALARQGTTGGGWLVGALGQSASWARLGPGGDVVEGGTSRITEGFGSDVALAPGRVLFAQGDRGLMVIDLDRLSASAGCCTLADLTSLALPVDCEGADCRNGVAVATASEDRAVVMGFTNTGSQRVVLYLIDTSSVDRMEVLAEADLSNAAAQGRDLFVSGDVVYAAGRVGTTDEGVVDVFDLVCE